MSPESAGEFFTTSATWEAHLDYLGSKYSLGWGFPGGIVMKNLPANAGDAGDTGLIPRLGRSSGVRHGNYSGILAWKIPWTEELRGLQPMGLQTVGHDRAHMHFLGYKHT